MAVELAGVSKSFGPVQAVRGLDLEVGNGEFMSLVGPSGCGKTTILRIIAGFTEADTGTVSIDGQMMNDVPARRRKVGIVFQDYALFPNLSVFDNIAFGLHARGQRGDGARRRVTDLLELVQLEGLEERRPSELSGGQKQRVALARALAIEPRLLLLDEPLSALDAKVRMELRYELRRIQRETRTTTIYVTHDQEEAMSVSDHVAVMQAGHIEQIGAPPEVYNRPATRFVASFIGTSTLLEVDLREPERGRAKWEDVELHVSPQEGPDGPRTLVVRPENVALEEDGGPDGAGADNRLAGSVAGKVFLGSTYRYAVDVRGHRFVVDSASPSAGRLDYGDPVTVRFGASDTWIL